MKKTYIDSETLLSLTDRFIEEKCNGLPSKCMISKLAKYIQNAGYERVNAAALRARPDLKEYLESQKVREKEDELFLAAYMPLDVERVLSKSRAAACKELMAHEKYVKRISDLAVSLSKDNERLQNENRDKEVKIKKLEDDIENLKEKTASYKEENKEIKKKLSAYKKLEETYMWPEIAKVLLAQDGIVDRDELTGIVDEAAVKNSMIKPDTRINTEIVDIFSKM